MSPHDATRRDPAALTRRISRQMLPLALACGLLIALGVPAAWGLMGWQRLRAQAQTQARVVAAAIARDALRDHDVWIYRLTKTVPDALAHDPDAPDTTVRVFECSGAPLLAPDAPAARLVARARAPVRWPSGALLATVEVSRPFAPLRVADLGLITLAIALGALLGALVYLLPVRVARRQAAWLASEEQARADAEVALQRANASLRERVDAATSALRALSARHVAVQDRERARLARELHDGVGQLLSAIRLELTRPEHAVQALELCDHAMIELRRALQDLRPLALDSGTLVEALRDCAERFELRTGVATSFRHEGDATCEEALAASLLRVCQEALHNIGRHARADEVGITLRVSQDQVTLIVRDDGIGFDPATTTRGLGLDSMTARAILLGGTFQLDSAPEQGTRLTLTLPRQPPHHGPQY